MSFNKLPVKRPPQVPSQLNPPHSQKTAAKKGDIPESDKYKEAGWKSVIVNSRQRFTLTDQQTFNKAMDKLVIEAKNVSKNKVLTADDMEDLINQIARSIDVVDMQRRTEPVIRLSAELLVQIHEINRTEVYQEKLRKALELAKHIEHEVVHGRNLGVNDKQTELSVLLTNFALLATNIHASDALPLIEKTRELGAYKRIGLDNMRALSRTVITGTIDVSAADSVIPASVQEKLVHNGFARNVVPPLCAESYRLLNLTEEEIRLLKQNEKMASLDVANLITKTKAEVVKIIEDNYNEAMNLAFKTADENLLKNSQDVKKFLGDIATIMGKGIVEGDWKRRHDSEKFKVYTRVADIESQLNDFSTEFLFRIQSIKKIENPEKKREAAIEMAAWCEYRINLTDHFLADGCGKTSALFANYVFMAAGIPPTDMPTMDRRNYFNFDVVPTTNIVIKRKEHNAAERGELTSRVYKERERWARHYKASFFPQDYRTITCDDAWSVPSVTLGQHLQTLSVTGEKEIYVIPEDAHFTNLHYSLRGEFEIAELASAIGAQDVQKLITYPLTRLSLFHTIVYAETELKTESDDEIVGIVRDVYQKLKKNQISEVTFNQWLGRKQRTFLRDARSAAEDAAKGRGDYAAQYREVLDTIKQRYRSGEYILGNNSSVISKPIPSSEQYPLVLAHLYKAEDLTSTNPKEIILRDPNLAIEEIAKKIISDRAYQDISNQFFEQVVEPLISKAVDDCEFERLEIPDPSERCTFMMAGAPACGKGTAVATVAKMAEDHLDVSWDNTIKVNTDTHRLIISHPNITGERAEFSGTLNNHEAGMLTDLAYSRLQKKVEEGTGPHILIDGVNMSKERMELGMANSGKLLLTVVTTPPALSLERAFTRGQGDGRFVPTSYNLSKHRQVSKNFLKELETGMGKNVEVILFDTNVPKGETPNRIMTADLATRTVIIYDKKKFAEFLAKGNLDVTATCAKELYMHDKDKLDQSYHEKLDRMGFLKIQYAEDSSRMRSGLKFTIFGSMDKENDDNAKQYDCTTMASNARGNKH